MNKMELLDLLAAHADALNEGEDMTEAFAARYPADATTVLPLLLLAQAVKAVLVPVSPSPLFTAGLGERLLTAQLTPDLHLESRRRVWIGAAAVGSLLSIAGLLFLLLRYLRPDQRRSQPATSIV